MCGVESCRARTLRRKCGAELTFPARDYERVRATGDRSDVPLSDGLAVGVGPGGVAVGVLGLTAWQGRIP